MASWSERGPAQLGSDNVLRFLDADHFLRELAGNLGRGRAFVKTKRRFEVQTTLAVRIEAPGVQWAVSAKAIVIFSKEGFVGLEFEDFEQSVLPRLDQLGEEAARRASPEQAAERTVIATMPEHELVDDHPDFGVEALPSDEERTGEMFISPAIVESLRPPDDLYDTHDHPAVRASSEPTEDSVADIETRAVDRLDDLDTHDEPYQSSRSPVQRDVTMRGDPARTMRLSTDSSLHGDGESGTIDLRGVSSVPPPAPPGIPLFGVERLEDKTIVLPRCTPNGIVRTNDEGTLLGAYLAEIRHGRWTLYGGPDGSLGQEVKIKIAGARVVALDGRIAARVGNWVTLEIADAEPLVEVLRDAENAWMRSVETLRAKAASQSPPEPLQASGDHPLVAPAQSPADKRAGNGALPPLEATQTTDDLVIAKAPTRPPSPIRVDTNDLIVSLTPAPEPSLAPPAPPPVPVPTPAVVEVAAGAEKAGEPANAAPEDDGPPRVAKLNNDVVAFARTKDLKHEIDTNLKNGGLFVESPPLPLRTRRSLKVSIGGVMTAVSIEADVVFAAGGRVGFSVIGASEAKAALERALETYSQSAPKNESTSTLDVVPQIVRAPNPELIALIPPFSGKILRPVTMGELLDFQNRKPKSTSDLTQSTVLAVFDYICRQGGKGVLSLRSGDSKMTVYFHEGSVAYIEATPFDEATSLGRILITTKKISEPALREGLERAKQQKRSLGKVLVSLGTITKKVLSEALREQTREKIDHTLSWKEGTFDWGAWREPPGDADLVLTKGVGIVARHMRQQYEHLGINDLEAMFAKSMGRIVVAKDNIESLATAVGFQQKELRFIELSLNGERPISDAVTASPIGRLASLRLIATGLASGMLAFKDGRSVPVTNVGPARTRSEKENPQMAQLKRDLKDRLQLMKGMNYFEVLGVHWSAHHRAYRAAYEKVRAEFKLDRTPLRDGPAEVIDLAKEILRIVETAYAMLSDERERVNYRKQLFDKTERQYSADMLVKQGEVALMRNDRVGAIEALETAVELDPSARNRSLLAQAREGKS